MITFARLMSGGANIEPQRRAYSSTSWTLLLRRSRRHPMSDIRIGGRPSQARAGYSWRVVVTTSTTRRSTRRWSFLQCGTPAAEADHHFDSSDRRGPPVQTLDQSKPSVRRFSKPSSMSPRSHIESQLHRVRQRDADQPYGDDDAGEEFSSASSPLTRSSSIGVRVNSATMNDWFTRPCTTISDNCSSQFSESA
jgi:hypothetical protein